MYCTIFKLEKVIVKGLTYLSRSVVIRILDSNVTSSFFSLDLDMI